MQEHRIQRRELEKVREESFSFQKKIICNWKLLKARLEPKDIIHSLISLELVAANRWDYIEKESRNSQMDSILSNVLKNIETSDDYDKFEAFVRTTGIELQSTIDKALPANGKAESSLRTNREMIEKELYPPDLIDDFLVRFILSPEDHERIRNKRNVRQVMAHIFLEIIMKPAKVEKGSMTYLVTCLQRGKSAILTYLSKLMDSDLPNGIVRFTGDNNLQVLIEKRDDCRNSMLSKWTYLKENLYPHEILIDALSGSGLIDFDRKGIIFHKPRLDQVYSILRNIIRRIDQPAMFSKLISILMENDDYVANKLLEKLSPNRIVRGKKHDFRDVQATLEYWKNDIAEEFNRTDVDLFLDCLVFDIDDHEVICETGDDKEKTFRCFYEKISDKTYIARGSLDCLICCLNTNDAEGKIKKSRQKLAEALLSRQLPEQVNNRTKITVKATDEILYRRNISSFTVGELKLTVNDPKSKETLEHEIFEVAEITKKENKEIDGLKLKVKDIKKSSIVVHLESDSGNVIFVVEMGIDNGDLTSFIRNLCDNENIKMHMTPEKTYNFSVSLHSRDQQKELYSVPFKLKEKQVNPKMRIIKANRKLFEDEYDPMPLLKSVFDDNVKQYKSVTKLSPEYKADFKQQFGKINKVPERRKRVKQFLDIAEDMIEAETLWDLLEETANAFSVKKMKDDIKEENSGHKEIRSPDSSSEEGLVFEGKYEVWITEEDVGSPLQSIMLEERQKKDKEKKLLEEKRRLEEEERRRRQEEEYRRRLEEERRRQEEENRRRQEEERLRQEEERRRQEETERRKRKSEELNHDVKFWKKIRTETLPRLDELKDELREANEKIRKAKVARNFTLGMTLVGGALFSIFTGGVSMAGALGAAAISGGTAGITFIIETYVEKGVLRRTQDGINKDKEATYHLITRVRAYRGTDNIPFADNLQKIKLEGIDDLAKDPLEKFISSFFDTESASLLKAVDKIIEFRVLLEHELQEVERIQGQYSFS